MNIRKWICGIGVYVVMSMIMLQTVQAYWTRPRISVFSVSNAYCDLFGNFYIYPGEGCTLNWETLYATSVSIEPDIGDVETSGSIDIFPVTRTVYRITATNNLGSRTDRLEVDVLTPRISYFYANRESIISGNSLTLYWQTSDASDGSIEPGIIFGESPYRLLDLDNDQITVSPTETTTYTLTVSGPDGIAAVSESVTVVVVDCDSIITDFHASSEKIDIGENSTLTWETEGADSVTIDQGIGVVELNGSINVSPTETTSYTITAEAAGCLGMSETVTIEVCQTPGDCDEDGLPDSWEMQYFGDLDQGPDDDWPDLDGLTNMLEYQLGTSPLESDSDNDGMPDGWEISNFGTLSQNAYDDYDGDGAINFTEYALGYNPNDSSSKPPSGLNYEYDELGRVIYNIQNP